MENTSNKNNQLAQQSTLPQLSQRLTNSLVKMLDAETKTDGKMELISITRELMPAGRPNFKDVVQYPMIRTLAAQHGDKSVMKHIFLLVKDFCCAINVVRNLNEDQMIDAAAMLLDECDNFRMEDYVMMFSMAKKGELIEFRDRIDLEIISKIMDEYWKIRKREGERLQEQNYTHLETMGPQSRILDQAHPLDAKLSEMADKLLGAHEGIREVLNQDAPSPRPIIQENKPLTGAELRDSAEYKGKLAQIEKQFGPPKTEKPHKAKK